MMATLQPSMVHAKKHSMKIRHAHVAEKSQGLVCARVVVGGADCSSGILFIQESTRAQPAHTFCVTHLKRFCRPATFILPCSESPAWNCLHVYSTTWRHPCEGSRLYV